jgi:hypothetical protein
MRRIHKVLAIGASSVLLTLTLTPAALAAGTVSPAHGKIGAGTAYKGTTSQRKACVSANDPCGKIKFNKSSGSVSGTITWYGQCTNKNVLISGTSFKANLTNGKFSVSGHYKAPINGGFTGHYTASIAGTVGATKAHGTFTGKAVVFKGSTKVTTCKSGLVTWNAHKVL